jgi:hypothetical protein
MASSDSEWFCSYRQYRFVSEMWVIILDLMMAMLYASFRFL